VREGEHDGKLLERYELLGEEADFLAAKPLYEQALAETARHGLLVGCGTPPGRASKSWEPLLKLDQIRPNVFTLKATGQELSALVAAARMALDLMRSDPRVPAETLELLTLVLRDYDHALARHEQADGRSSRPSVDSSEDEMSPL
jgi:hypothetical protein